MRLARRVAAGVALGVFAGFVAALLRPRNPQDRAPVDVPTGPPAPEVKFRPADADVDSSQTVIADPVTRPIDLSARPPRSPTGGTA